MHHGVYTISPLEGIFSDKKQRKVVQPKYLIEESTRRLCKYNALYHRKLKSDMVHSVHITPCGLKLSHQKSVTREVKLYLCVKKI